MQLHAYIGTMVILFYITLFLFSLGPTEYANLFSVIFVEGKQIKIDRILLLNLNSGSRSNSSKRVLKVKNVERDTE